MKATKPPFRFKQFEVHHDECAMKVGTDGVLLGAWTQVTNSSSILDIGTGTGLLSLMLAQRCSAKISAIEIDEKAFKQAGYNFLTSPWSERLSLHHTSLQKFSSSENFDHIVCNPPFFNNKNLQTSRDKARNNTSLSLSLLISKSAGLLSSEGSLSLVLPYTSLEDLKKEAVENNLHINRLLFVKGTLTSKIKRILAELSFTPRVIEENTLIIEPTERHEYSFEYEKLLKDFLVIF